MNKKENKIIFTQKYSLLFNFTITKKILLFLIIHLFITSTNTGILYSRSADVNKDFTKAQEYYYEKDYINAIKYYKKAFKQDKTIKSECYIEIAKSYINLASINEKINNIEKAKEYYQLSLQYDSYNKDYLLKFAFFLDNNEFYNEALDIYEKALKLGWNRALINRKISDLKIKMTSDGTAIQTNVKNNQSPAIFEENEKLINKIKTSVVDIYNEPLGRYTTYRKSRNRKPKYGVGCFINKNGYILTSYHVVAYTAKLTVTIHNKKRYKAVVIGYDKDIDIAVIKIKGRSPDYLTFDDSDNLEIEDPVVAVDPIESELSFTPGIINSLHRMDINMNPVEDYIQTDSVIESNNSGSPLLNAKGKIIGVNTRKIPNNETNGFAIPSKLMIPSINKILSKTKIERNWLGLFLQQMDPMFEKKYKIKSRQGLWVEEVIKDSPAHKAGIKRNDIIIEADGDKIESYHDLFNILHKKERKDSIELKVISDGEEDDIDFFIGLRPEKYKLDIEQIFHLYVGAEIISERIDKKFNYKVIIEKVYWDYDENNKIKPGSFIWSALSSNPDNLIEELIKDKFQLYRLVQNSYTHDGHYLEFSILLKKIKESNRKEHYIKSPTYKIHF